MNITIMKGRLIKEPEVRATQDGKSITRITIAVDRKKGEADFFNWVAFNQNADFIAKYFKKGSEILIEGRCENDNYEKNGNKVYGFKWVIDRAEFSGSKVEKTEQAKVRTEEFPGFMVVPDNQTELPFN